MKAFYPISHEKIGDPSLSLTGITDSRDASASKNDTNITQNMTQIWHKIWHKYDMEFDTNMTQRGQKYDMEFDTYMTQMGQKYEKNMKHIRDKYDTIIK